MGGFSLVEVLIVVGILGVIALVGLESFQEVSKGKHPDRASSVYIEALYRAKANAEVMQNDSAWGVAVFADNITLFEGDSFASRETDSDVVELIPSVSVSGVSEIVFSVREGVPDTSGTTTFNNAFATSSVFVSDEGRVERK